MGKKFDFVVFDASLHHADRPVELLRQVREILSDNGSIVCIREAIAPSLPILEQVVRMKTSAFERRYGVTENIFTLSQWTDLFKNGGFRMHAVALPTSINWEKKHWKNSLLSQIPFLSKLMYGVDSRTIAFVAVPA